MKKTTLAVVLCVLPWAAHAGLFDDTEARKQIADLKQQMTAEQQQTQNLQDRLGRVEQSVKDLKLTEILNQQEALRSDMAKLRGQLETQAYQLDQLAKRQKDLYADLDARVRALEGGSPAAKPADTASKPAASGDEAAYTAALERYRQGKYAEAIKGFQGFIEQYPASKLAPNAYYWQGFSFAAQSDCKTAVEVFQKLIAHYPDSAKVPDAQLSMANCQLDLNDKAAAKKTLQQLVSKYPLTPAGEQAKKLLPTLDDKPVKAKK